VEGQFRQPDPVGGVDVTVQRRGADVPDTPARRVLEVGAEALQEHPAGLEGRLEMGEQPRRGQRLGVVFRPLPRDAEQQVPGHGDALLGAPLEQLDVLQCGSPLAHEAEHAVMDALDARLDGADTGGAELRHLAPGQGGTDVIKQPEIQVVPAQPGHQLPELAGIQHVVHRLEVQTVVAAGLGAHLPPESPRRLRPEGHGLAVLAAERAGRLLAPPAAAGAFVQNPGLDAVAQPLSPQLIEKLGVVGDRRLTERDQRRRGGGEMEARCIAARHAR